WGSYTGWIGPYRSSYGSEVTFAGEVIVISDAAESTLYLFAEESDDESADADEDFTESDDEFVDVDEDFVDSDSESIDESTELPSGETKDSGCGCLLLPDNL
ncbi:hypothetical protein KAH37_10035, partial [bacterium]|nr:hypothetical protein [bacterium]